MRLFLFLALVGLAGPSRGQPAARMPADPLASKRCLEAPAAFGCANGANLVTMARPEDLAAGRAATPSPGALEAAAVGRLLADKVKELRREGTESAGGGSQ
jgi:type IV pilus biogenesis protein CpaD/CtpE